MSKNYEDYQPINPMPPRRRSNSLLSFVQYSIIILLVVALVVSALFFIVTHKDSGGGGNNNKLPQESETLPPEPDETTGDATTAPETGTETGPDTPVIDLTDYMDIEVPKAQINKGSLILVSANNKVVYPTANELIDFYGNKPNSYQISAGNMKISKEVLPFLNDMMDGFFKATKKNDIIIWTSYRDEARQTQVYNEYVAKYGIDESAPVKKVAKPGESDHNTGLGVALKAYINGIPYKLTDVNGYSWIEENCHKYGFIERYPSDKKEKTGIDYSDSYYIRYVGIPHSEIMKARSLTLEEYIILLKDYTFGNAHYDYTASDGTEYDIYYVRAEGDGNTCTVSVPKDKEYTISGNNMDGFIVTVKG